MPEDTKASLRVAMLAARRALDADAYAAKSTAIIRRIEAMPAWRSARSVLFYMPTRGEVDVLPLLRQALERGRRCLLPRCAPGCVLQLLPVKDLQRDVAPGTFGLLEPCAGGPDCAGEPVDVILVPGVAFDCRGYRIGYGKGYYDRLLPGYRDRAVLIAPSFALQIVPRVPEAPHDVPVRWIATENELIDCSSYGG